MDVHLDITENLEIDGNRAYDSYGKLMMTCVGSVDLAINNIIKQWIYF